MQAKEICQFWRYCSGVTSGLLWTIVALILGALAIPARAKLVSPLEKEDICQVSARKAALETGVPLNVLLAITLSETGRKKNNSLRPWPWTVNMEGTGRWFDTRQAALEFATANFKRGARSFDIGCFQINYKWHGRAFSSIDHMFDPKSNALYAARYLSVLYNEKGNWKDAAGAYHSRTPARATKYADRFTRIYTALGGLPSTPSNARAAIKTQKETKSFNRYPLLQRPANSSPNNGSLVFLLDSNNSQSLIMKTSGRLF